ncbi:7925_t:CDS:2, partial [Entrophospora sp. SA101]
FVCMCEEFNPNYRDQNPKFSQSQIQKILSNMTEKKKALVLIADGSEEIEVVVTVDVLRRAQIEVDVVGVKLKNSNFAKCSRDVKLVPDKDFAKLTNSDAYDIIIIPGGTAGANTLASNTDVQNLLSSFHKSGKFVSAICAGPLAIKSANVNKGGKITSYPSIKADLENDYKYSEDRVVVDNRVITSQGPGSTFLFALTIIEQLLGKKKRDEVSQPLALPPTL